jgi:ubiquinone/menaquinone biosynthesis C-methylase UbiE
MDYGAPGAPETYRRGRELPAGALALWRDVVRELVPDAGVTRVADVGCGIGRFTGWLAEILDTEVVGIDPSFRMLSAAAAAARVRYVVGTAEALPVRAGSLDLAFLSMVYQHVAEPGVVVTELLRTLRPGGRIILRTPTSETLGGYLFLRFFPEARALDERRLPPRAAVRAVFRAGGLREVAHRIVEQRVADGPEAYCERIRGRALSSLQLISDDAFGRGLAALDAHCRTLPPDRAVAEPVDVFVFER